MGVITCIAGMGCGPGCELEKETVAVVLLESMAVMMPSPYMASVVTRNIATLYNVMYHVMYYGSHTASKHTLHITLMS